MKPYTPSDFKKLALEMLEKTAKTNPNKLVVGWISSTPIKNELGKISYIQICEHEIHSGKDFDRWQERIQINPQEIVYNYDREKGEIRDFKEVLKDIKKCNKFYIAVCIKIIKKIKDREYLVKLLGKNFILRTEINLKYDLNRRFMHDWFCVCDDKEDHARVHKAEFFEVDDDEVIAHLI